MNGTTTSSALRAGNGDPLLKVEGLRAGYKRGKAVVCDLSFAVWPGEIVGLIGPNGAGKSTTIKAVLGLVEKSQGAVKLPENQDYTYVPELPALYEELTLWEHLEVIAMAHGMEEPAFKRRATALLREFGLEDYQYAFPGGFSKGMRQKTMILCAILVQPNLYLVDEPFNGLDPYALQGLLDWFTAEKARGAGIVITTHVLDVAQRICDRLMLINNGQKVADGTLEQLRMQAGLPNGGLLDIFLALMKR